MKILSKIKRLLRCLPKLKQANVQTKALNVKYIAVRFTSGGMLCFYRCNLPEKQASAACWEAVKKDSLKVALTKASDPNFVHVVFPTDDSSLQCKTEFHGLRRTKSDRCEYAHYNDITWIWGEDKDVLNAVEKLMTGRTQGV